MFMMLKTVLEALHQGPISENQQAKKSIPPAQLLLRSLRTILTDEDLEQAKVEQLLTCARRALDALPLSTVEYAQAAAALENAHGYYQTDVPRAARYELRILHRDLRGKLA